jgi:hypothetical protein
MLAIGVVTVLVFGAIALLKWMRVRRASVR